MHARIGINEIGFHEDFLVGKPGTEESALRKVGKGNVSIDVACPGLAPAVYAQHESNRRGRCARTTVATVADGPPGAMLNAFFANVAVAKESGGRAVEAVVVQGHHHGDSSFGAGRENGWRHHYESIVDVHHVRSFVAEQRGNFPFAVPSPNGFACQVESPQPGIAFDLKVTAAVGAHIVALALEHLAFLFEDNVFAAG